MTRWQQFYQEEPELALVGHSQCVTRAGRLFQDHNVGLALDLGCGTGRESRYLAQTIRHVVSLDYSAAGLSLARNKGTANLVRSDARRLPFPDGVFDAVHCYGLLHEFHSPRSAQDRNATMLEVRRVLKSKGLLVLAVLAGDPVNGDPDIPNVQLFSDDMFFDAATGFDCLEYKEYDDLSCTGNIWYHIHYGAFIKSL